VADHASHWIAVPCLYALTDHHESIQSEGQASLADLAHLMASARRVILLLAASDVTLLHVKIPPMPTARLRLALPNLIEDHLITDPADCVMVAGDTVGALRTVAVVQRDWLQLIVQAVKQYGARQIIVLPAQLCLVPSAEHANAVVTVFGDQHEIALCLENQQGLGVSLLATDAVQAAKEIIETLCVLVPAASITLYVPQNDLTIYQQTVDQILPIEQRITVLNDQWPYWINGIRGQSMNLALGLHGASNAGIDWHRWRWPLVLGMLLLMINIGAFNLEWLRLSREATQLRNSMVQIYKTAYPKETVILDPEAQLRQKIVAAQREAGQPAADDFLTLASVFATVWSSVSEPAMLQAGSPQPPTTTISKIEYKDRSLLVTPQSGIDVSQAKLKSALAARNLSLSQSTPGVWQIRSAR
jgi:general secretion pathway protein L